MVVCKTKHRKEDPNCTRITVTGSQICYPRDVGTPTGSLDLVKIIINSVLSHRNAHFVSFDFKNFYFQTPMERSKYVRIKLSDIPQEFIEEYDLRETSQNDWIYFEILCGVMAYHNPAYWQTTSCIPVSRSQDIMKTPQHLASVATSGVLLNSFYSWTTSESNI